MAGPACIVESRDRLGEGPCWDPAVGRLYWFDIKGRRLRWHEPASGKDGHCDLGLQASAAAPRATGGLLVATEAGLGVFDPKDGGLQIRQPLDGALSGFRSNDGRQDSTGAFWWSVMDGSGGKRAGAVYRTAGDWTTSRQVEGVRIANALCSSPDGRTLYLADSAEKTLYAYDHDPASGALSNRRVFARTEQGAPDGATVDADGFVWNAQWGAWRVVRYAPDGRINRVVEFPVEQPSSCAFGGPGLRTLFVTSARDGLSDASLERQPLAGGLFAFEPGVAGLQPPPFAG